MQHQRPLAELPLISPPQEPDGVFSDAAAAVADLQARYARGDRLPARRASREVMAGATPEGRYRAFYPSGQPDHRELRQGQLAAVVRPCHRARGLRDDDHPARPLRGLPDPADRAPDPEPRHAGPDRHLGHADPAAFRDGRGRACRGVDRRPRCTGRCAISSTCRTSTPPTTTSSTAAPGSTPSGARPLAPFTAQRIDYSLARLAHYTATSPDAFPEPRALHQLPVLHGRVRGVRAGGAGRPGLGLHRASSSRATR